MFYEIFHAEQGLRKIKVKKVKCRLMQFLFGASRVKTISDLFRLLEILSVQLVCFFFSKKRYARNSWSCTSIMSLLFFLFTKQ